MPEPQILTFDTVRIDMVNERIWNGAKEWRLTLKAFTTLRYLITHAGRLIAKEELLQAVWSDIAVGEAVLTVAIGDIRRALGDNRRTPRFIETVHRRGYRFIAPLPPSQLIHSSPWKTQHAVPLPSPSQLVRRPSDTLLLGREAELAQLHQLFHKTRQGERQSDPSTSQCTKRDWAPTR